MYQAGRAGALVPAVPVVTAGAWVHCRNKHKIGRIGYGGHRPRDRDLPGLQRLAEDFEHSALELRQFIQKQDPVMGQTDLPGPRYLAPSDEGNVRDRMVRRAEGSARDKGFATPYKDSVLTVELYSQNGSITPLIHINSHGLMSIVEYRFIISLV